jgi:hypothetical protein
VYAFDFGRLPRVSTHGDIFGSNPEAAADSFAMTQTFLDARLKSK